MSPILVRPVREQLEHDRVIRLLHGKSRRRYDAGMNPGMERNVAVGTGTTSVYPDLVLFSPERSKRLEAVVEVETGESVNHLEALAEWAHFAKIRAAFHLYVPASMVDVARRLVEDNHITVTEIWSYHSVGDDVRFTLIHRSKEAPVLEPLPPVRPAAPAARVPKVKAPVTPVKKTAAKEPAKRKVAASKAAAPKAPAKRVTSKRAPVARAAKAAPAARRKAPAAKKVARPAKRK